MIITLSGENSFLLQKSLTEMVDDFENKHSDLAIERIDGQEADYQTIIESSTSLPFLVNEKMVVLRNPAANKQFLDNFEDLMKQIPDTTKLVIVEPKLDKRQSYYKFLQKNTDFLTFNEVESNNLPSWSAEYAKKLNGVLSTADARYLIDRIGSNQMQLANEIDKLTLYDPSITRKTIDLLTEESPQSTIFNLLEAAFSGNTKQAIAYYEDQRAQKVEPQQILAMIAWQLHILAVVKVAGNRSDTEIAKQAKLNPYVVSKARKIVNKLSKKEIQELINELLIIDIKSKSSRLNIDLALQNYLIKL